MYDQVGSFLHDQVIGLFGQDVEQGTDSEGILDLPFEVNLDAILEQLGGLSDGILGEGGFKLPIDIDTSLFDEEGGPLAGLFGGLFGTGEEEGEGGLQIPISFDQASVEEGVTILSEMFSGLFSTGEGEGEEGGSGLQIPIDFDLEAAMEAFAPIQEMIYQLTGAGEDEEGLLNVIQFAVDPEGMALAALDNLLLNLLNIVGGEGEDQTPWILNLVAGEGLEAVQGKVEGILSNLQSIASKPWTATISIIQSVLGGGDGDNRQYGGPVGMTGAYLVGETGPELVTLPQGAYVTPSVRTGVLLGGASGESAGGSVNHNNLYISVDGVSDARSFVRELRYELRAQGLDFAEVS
ncbi:MAG: hypothetical protein JXJ17_17130 [Anaerolineae bacterium]|nr:hypothetical protein [Anaerolineae bacterium]